jgi:hypothetical protein
MDEDKKWPALSAKVEEIQQETPTPSKKPHVQMTVLRETSNGIGDQ